MRVKVKDEFGHVTTIWSVPENVTSEWQRASADIGSHVVRDFRVLIEAGEMNTNVGIDDLEFKDCAVGRYTNVFSESYRIFKVPTLKP